MNHQVHWDLTSSVSRMDQVRLDNLFLYPLVPHRATLLRIRDLTES
jgi:hypothetical protein